MCNGTLELDCAGVCGGTSTLSGCDNTCRSTLANDKCGVCGGDGSSCGGGDEITDGCDLPESSTTGYLHLTSDGAVLYKSNYAIGGFQFDVDGATVNGGSGGDMSANGLIGQSLGSTFLSFSLSGSSIPAGCGTLVNLSLSGEATGLSGIIVSDQSAGSLYFEYYSGGGSEPVLGCTDMGACNYDSDATEDDGGCTYAEDNFDCDGNCTAGLDCNGDCAGSALEDECGVCDGDNLSCADCAGVPNGDAEDLGCGCGEPGPSGCDNACGSTAELDECGLCGGDNSTCFDCAGVPNGDAIDLGCGCGEAGPSGCDNACGSTAELDECGVCGGDGSSCGGSSGVSLSIQNVDTGSGTLDVYMSNDEEVGGFQFELTGITITNASAPPGYFMSTSATTVLGFSLTGATIAPGSGILSTVSFTNYSGGSICFGEDTGSSGSTAISDASGGYIAAEWGDCYCSTVFDECGVCGGDSSTCLDCAGVPNGSAEDFGCGCNEPAPGECGCNDLIDLGCGCGEAGPSGCDNECGSTAEEDECGVCGGDNSSCLSECVNCLYLNGDYVRQIANFTLLDTNALMFSSYVDILTNNGYHNDLYFDLNLNGEYDPMEDICGDLDGDYSCEDQIFYDNFITFNDSIAIELEYVNNELSYIQETQYFIDIDYSKFCTFQPEVILLDRFLDFESASDNEAGRSWSCFDIDIDQFDNTFSYSQPLVSNLFGQDLIVGYIDFQVKNAVQGCLDQEFCNYSLGANTQLGDGSVCLEVDECGVCGGDGSSCTVSSPFEYNQSTLQAFYYFESVTLNGQELDSLDWVGAFNDDVCVGATQWNTEECGEGICDVPVMGDYGENETAGYMNLGDIPSFKIYDQSENMVFNAVPSDNYEWAPNGLYLINQLSYLAGCSDIDACNYSGGVTEDDGSCEYAQQNYDCDGNCIATIDCNGDCAGTALEDTCGVCSGGDSGHVADSDIDECGDCFGDGIEEGACDCDGNIEDECGVCAGDGSSCAMPDLFSFNQSTLQAFYFFNSVMINGNDVENDDWVGVFKDDVCVGARQWNVENCGSNTCEVPAMGFDDNGSTEGYMLSGDLPTFKVYDSSENRYYIAVPSEAFPWESNSAFVASQLNVVTGCLDVEACNYNSAATEDDGSCEYAQQNYDCDGNCIAGLDCYGVCGGAAVVDDCGVCEGDGSSCAWAHLEVTGDVGSIYLTWSAYGEGSMSSSREECVDDPEVCIWEEINVDYSLNQEQCESMGGTWGSYLSSFSNDDLDRILDLIRSIE